MSTSVSTHFHPRAHAYTHGFVLAALQISTPFYVTSYRNILLFVVFRANANHHVGLFVGVCHKQFYTKHSFISCTHSLLLFNYRSLYFSALFLTNLSISLLYIAFHNVSLWRTPGYFQMNFFL